MGKRNERTVERQIDEAVTITETAKISETLYSKSEWNQCLLPRKGYETKKSKEKHGAHQNQRPQ